MSEKMMVQLNENVAEMELRKVEAKQEKLRRKFRSKSNWSIIKKGPLGTFIYGMFIYPQVFFDHIVMESPLYSLTVRQETILRSIKWSLNSPLKTLRKSGSFSELLIKTFRCSEQFHSLSADVTRELGVQGYWLGPIKYKQRESEATILYLHGGGYVALSSLVGLRSLCYILKNLRKGYNKHVRVIAIDYTLAPEGPFPAGLNCVEKAYKWLVNSGIPGSENVFLCGDSAGAGLSLALLQKLYPDGLNNNDNVNNNVNIPLPLGVILISPWVELSCDSLSYFTNAKFDWLESHSCQFAAECYIFGEEGNQSNNKDLSSQPKISKEIILDWLEKVEGNLDLNKRFSMISNYSNKRLSNLSNYSLNKKRLSNYSLNSDKRYSGIKASRRGSAVSQKRSYICESIVEEIIYGQNERKSLDDFKNDVKSKIIESDKIDTKDENPYRDPLVSPLHVSHHTLAEFPPIFISYGGKELFRDDIEMFAKKCIESKKAYKSFGNDDYEETFNDSLDGQHPDVVVEMDEDMVHNYPMFIDVFGKHSKKTLDRAIHFIATRMPLIANMIPNSRKIPSTI